MSTRRHQRAIAVLVVALTWTGGVSAVAHQATPVEAPPPVSRINWWDDAVCYEIFVRSFFDSDGDGIGDFNGITAKLDYLNDGDPTGGNDLGVTCVWLMPMFESTSYHGYDVVDYGNVEQDYGSNEDFRAFVAAAHERGIRVVLDLVLNHTSIDHPWFQAALRDPESPYRDWYIFADEDPGYLGPWGAQAWHKSPVADEFYYGLFWSGMPDLNFENPAVTAEAERISAYWLTDVGIDGFRLDAIKHLIEDGKVQENTPATHAWLRDYRTFLESTAPTALTIGEIFNASADSLVEYFPDQLHTYFNFAPGQQCLTAAVNGGAMGVEGVVVDALTQIPDQRWAPFLTNHDQARAMNALNGDVDRAKIAAMCLLTMPGLPFVYYGEEIGMSGMKPDERIRTPMQWSAEPTGGFTTDTPWQPFQDDLAEINVAAQSDDPDSLLNLYRELIDLHATHPALGHGDLFPLESGERSVLAFLRQTNTETVLVVLNFGKAEVAGFNLSGSGGLLAPGAYEAVSIFSSDQAETTLTIGDDGNLADLSLGTVAGRTGYIFQVSGIE